MSQINETLTTGRDYEGFKTAYLTRVAKWSNLTLSKQFTATLINQLYTISIKSRKPIGKTYALVSPKHCELSPWFVADLQIKTNQFFVLRLAKLIFKSGLNRILLTVVRSSAATLKKTFLMLARLSEITNHRNWLGQQQLLIDNYV